MRPMAYALEKALLGFYYNSYSLLSFFAKSAIDTFCIICSIKLSSLVSQRDPLSAFASSAKYSFSRSSMRVVELLFELARLKFGKSKAIYWVPASDLLSRATNWLAIWS